MKTEFASKDLRTPLYGRRVYDYWVLSNLSDDFGGIVNTRVRHHSPHINYRKSHSCPQHHLDIAEISYSYQLLDHVMRDLFSSNNSKKLLRVLLLHDQSSWTFHLTKISRVKESIKERCLADHRLPSLRSVRISRRNSREISSVSDQMAEAGSYLFIIRSRPREKNKNCTRAREHACDTTLRGGRHRVTYIVMGPRLVSKIGCRATTFQTTRDSYGRALLSARETKIPRPPIIYNCALEILLHLYFYLHFFFCYTDTRV